MKETRVPLQDIDDEELIRRTKNLALNIYRKNGQLCLPSDVVANFKELAEECSKRNRAIDFHSHMHTSDSTPLVHSLPLVRYGKRKRLEDMMEGRISFGLSKDYISAPLESQKDNEMVRSARQPNQVVEINGVKYNASRIELHTNVPEDRKCPLNR